MTNHISSSLYTDSMNKLNVNTLKGFIKGIIVAQTKLKEKDVARNELNKHLVKVKKLAAAKKPSVNAIKKHISEIEGKVNTVLQKEAKLIRSSAYENKTITELKKKINNMEEEIAQKDAQNMNLLKLNDDHFRILNETIDTLKERIDSYISDKSERDRRVKALEEKIKKKVEIKGVNERLMELEEKYKQLEQKGESEEEDLSRIRSRIDSLKLEM